MSEFVTRLHSILIQILLLTLGMFLCVGPSYSSGLDDRVVILPPMVGIDYDGDAESLWRTIHRGYFDGVAGIEVVPLEKVIAAMEGDTLATDLVMLEDAIGWGQHFDADYVVMTETHGSRVAIQKLDPWTMELFGPEEANNALSAVRDLEHGQWVYGRNLRPAPNDYAPPQLEHANSAISVWLHENHEYPQEALIELQGCFATVSVSVSPEGVPLDIRIYSVDPQGFGFEEVVAKALWTMRFTPAKRGDKVVHGMWISTVDISPTM